MTKEELARIESAYYCGLKVQIWFNGYWQDFDKREYPYGGFSENRMYRIVGSGYAEKAEKRIAELEQKLKAEKEYNETLRKEVDEYTNSHTLCAKYKELEKENAEAKNLIEELASSLSVVGECDEEECELINKAQKFINKPIF